LAKSVNQQLQIDFFNHADHAFSVAIGISDNVFEVSMNGWQLRDVKKTIDRSSFIGLPIKIKNQIGRGCEKVPNLILTGGASYKFRPVGDRSLPKILATILSKYDHVHLILVGPKWHDWWWWSLFIKFSGRIKRFSFLRRDDYESYLNRATIYLDSYPIGGGTAFPEALMSGLNILGLKEGTFGSTCADALRVNSESELTIKLDLIINQDESYLLEQAEIREQCTSFHGLHSVMDRISLRRDKNTLVVPPNYFLENPPVKYFELAWAKRNHVNLPKLYKFMGSDLGLQLIKIYYRYFGLFNIKAIDMHLRLIVKNIFGEKVACQ
jgi:hypothetical protein